MGEIRTWGGGIYNIRMGHGFKILG